MYSSIKNQNYFSRLEHALKEKENAKQERDDMESKLNDLTQHKYIFYLHYFFIFVFI